MSEGSPELVALAAELSRRTGLRIDDGTTGRLDRALPHDARHADWAGLLAARPDLADTLVDASAIDESFFLRHPEQLTYLQDTILPRLLSERPADHRLQVWSAGCADGEEAYSVAMLLADAGLRSRSDVLGTDLTAAALERARAATYSRWALRSLDAETRDAFFTLAGRNRFRLSDAVAASVEFRQHNLCSPCPPEPATGAGFDVILCRNVLLHLTPHALAEAFALLVSALAPGGWLITSPADPTPVLSAPRGTVEPVVLPSGGVIFRRPAATATPSAAPRASRALPTPTVRRRSRPVPVERRAPRPAPARDAGGAVRSAPDVRTADGRLRCDHARTLLSQGDATAAVREAIAATFLEPELPAAHLVLGLAAATAGQRSVAARAFHRATELLLQRDPDEPVELCDGETASSLVDLARAHALLMREPAA